MKFDKINANFTGEKLLKFTHANIGIAVDTERGLMVPTVFGAEKLSLNELSRKGANVIFQDVHVSGHACREDIKLIYSLVNPKYSIPVHGEYKHLIAQAKIAEELGIPKENIRKYGFAFEGKNVLIEQG